MDEVKSTLELWFGMKFGDKSDTNFRHFVTNRLGMLWALEGQSSGRFFELDLYNNPEKKIKFTISGEELVPNSTSDESKLKTLNEQLKAIEEIFKGI